MDKPNVANDPLIRVIAAVIRRGDEYLVCQRPIHKRRGGLWEFPGGKCEDGESDFEAARRELREELGVDVVCVAEPRFSAHDEGSPYVSDRRFTELCIRGQDSRDGGAAEESSS